MCMSEWENTSEIHCWQDRVFVIVSINTRDKEGTLTDNDKSEIQQKKMIIGL